MTHLEAVQQALDETPPSNQDEEEACEELEYAVSLGSEYSTKMHISFWINDSCIVRDSDKNYQNYLMKINQKIKEIQK